MRALQLANKRAGVPVDRLVQIPEKGRAEDPAGWAAIDKLNGVHDDVAGYGIELPEGAAPEVKALFEKLAGDLKAEGVGKTAFGKVLAAYVEGQKADQDARTKANNEREEAIRAEVAKEFGAKLDYYRTEIPKLFEIKGADGKPLVSPEGLERLNAKGWGQDLDFLRILGWMVDQRAEPGDLPGGGNANTGARTLTPAAAKAERIQLENDPVKGKALRDARDPQHSLVVAERNRLFALERGETPKA